MTKEKQLQDLRVLVIDDAVDNRLLIKYLLTHEGAIVSEAASGQEGVTMALADQSDIVLMDIQMPGMDGYESARLLREKKFAGAVLALTAYDLSGEREYSLMCGFNDHVTKPIQKDILVNTILKYANL